MSIMDLIEKGKKAVNKRKTKTMLQDTAIGATIGVTFGAVAAVLLTPKSGKETREDIVTAAKEVPVKAKEFFERAEEKVEEAKETVKETKNKLAKELQVQE